jgi:hypothetical protein
MIGEGCAQAGQLVLGQFALAGLVQLDGLGLEPSLARQALGCPVEQAPRSPALPG